MTENESKLCIFKKIASRWTLLMNGENVFTFPEDMTCDDITTLALLLGKDENTKVNINFTSEKEDK